MPPVNAVLRENNAPSLPTTTTRPDGARKERG